MFVAGKDITFVAKVDSSNLLRKPAMKWLKGKWLDLGSKAGKHLQFKESYDRNTKVHVCMMYVFTAYSAPSWMVTLVGLLVSPVWSRQNIYWMDCCQMLVTLNSLQLVIVIILNNHIAMCSHEFKRFICQIPAKLITFSLA